MGVTFLTNEDRYDLEQKITKKLDTTELESAIRTALSEAKSSGEFDGTNGESGHTPEIGVDYFTEADKAQIVADVIEELTKGGCLLLAKRSPSE